MIKMYTGLQVKYLLFLSYFNKTWLLFYRFSNNKFNEHAASGSRIVPCGRTEGQTEMTKLIDSFQNFTNAPTNDVDSYKWNWLTLQLFLKSTQWEGV